MGQFSELHFMNWNLDSNSNSSKIIDEIGIGFEFKFSKIINS